MTYENTTTELQKPAPKLLTAFLANAVVNNLKKEVGNQNWLGALTLLQYSDNNISPDSTAIHYKWHNIPDILYTVNSNIRQQLLPTKVYKKVKLQQPNQDTTCRKCEQTQESTTHIMCGCATTAQSLYKSRHDKLLRPYYHYLLYKCGFENNYDTRPWYEQSPPVAVVENEGAKIMWDIEFHLPRGPQNHANKIDMALNDKKRQVWLLLEGAVCAVGKIKERSTFKQDKYRELRSGIKQLYPEKS